ncbi:MAG: hypothetical protein MR227_04130 [Firmicutes bacterium]|nr:hypothetical protein [Bacillota bacterium]
MKKELDDSLYLVQVILLIALIMFFIMSIFVKETKIIYQILLSLILILIAYNNRKTNKKIITILYLITSLCVIFNIVLGG